MEAHGMVNNIESYNTNFEHEGNVYHTQVTIEYADDKEIIDYWLDYTEPHKDDAPLLPKKVRTEFRDMAVAEYKRRFLDLRI